MTGAALAGSIGVAWKVVELCQRVDPLSGTAVGDPASLGVSRADEAALELALQAAEVWSASVTVVSVGPPNAATAAAGVLRGALQRGADALRVPFAGADDESSSERVAALAAAALSEARPGLLAVFCGDASVDRGTGAVPAFLAACLGAAQLLGMASVRIGEQAGRLEGERRLDGGRRERLGTVAGSVPVVSVEAAAARLRRAPLPGVLRAGQADVRTLEPRSALLRTAPAGGVSVEEVAPYRPRTELVAAPPAWATPLERIRLLTGSLSDRKPQRILHLPPDEAAGALLAQLAEWGELA